MDDLGIPVWLWKPPLIDYALESSICTVFSNSSEATWIILDLKNIDNESPRPPGFGKNWTHPWEIHGNPLSLASKVHAHRIHGAGWFLGQMLVNISAPWILWDVFVVVPLEIQSWNHCSSCCCSWSACICRCKLLADCSLLPAYGWARSKAVWICAATVNLELTHSYKVGPPR